MQNKILTISEKDGAGERLDRFLASVFKDTSRSELARLIKGKQVTVNQEVVKPSAILKVDDVITIDFRKSPEKSILKKEKMSLNIIYEDDQVIVLNKPAGIVVHPAHGNESGTLINALLEYFPDIEKAVYDADNPVSVQRPGLVHRLDKDTSGVMVIAKTARALHSLSRQIINRNVKKVYWAIVYGWPRTKDGRLVNYLGRHLKNRKKMADIGLEKGKEAISEYKVLNSFITKKGEKFSLVEYDIKTGRTHQIRVQSAIAGFPIMGDITYGSRESILSSGKMKIARQLLHAKQISFTLPGENKQKVFEAPLPDDFNQILKTLEL